MLRLEANLPVVSLYENGASTCGKSQRGSSSRAKLYHIWEPENREQFALRRTCVMSLVNRAEGSARRGNLDN
jgi:hypothetical protein